VASIAGEVREPQRNIPIAFVGGVVLLIAVYSLVNLSYYLVIPAAEMKTLTDTPVATEACRRLLGPVGLLLASAAILVSVFGALGGNMLVGPRGVFALSRDGLAPGRLGTVHPRYETPFAATLFMTVVTVGFIFAVAGYARAGLTADPNKPPFDLITDFVVFGAGLFETLAVASIFVFRRSHPPATVRLPYRCPGYPVVPAVFVACMVGVLGNMLFSPEQRDVAVIGLGIIAAGAAAYAGMRSRGGG
jgi:amino acid transporter